MPYWEKVKLSNKKPTVCEKGIGKKIWGRRMYLLEWKGMMAEGRCEGVCWVLKEQLVSVWLSLSLSFSVSSTACHDYLGKSRETPRNLFSVPPHPSTPQLLLLFSFRSWSPILEECGLPSHQDHHELRLPFNLESDNFSLLVGCESQYFGLCTRINLCPIPSVAVIF